MFICVHLWLNRMFHWIYTHVPTWAYVAAISHFVILGTVAYMILLERKVASWTQDRIGPNRVGFDFGILPFKFLKRAFGLGQPLADGLKFVLKEDYRPKGADMVLFTIAPAMMILVIILSIAVLPWGGVKQTTRDVDVTGTTSNSGVEAARANLPPNAEVVVDPKTVQIPSGTYPILRYFGPPGATAYNQKGTVGLVTYERTNAAGQTRQYTRLVDIGGYTEKDENYAVKARLPADAVLLAADSARAGQQVNVDLPIEIVKQPDGTFREAVRNVSYQWDFAAGRLNIGVLYILAVLSLAVYGVVVGGWASNNKYSFLGGLRATANMISYEIPLGLAILCVVVMFGTLDLTNLIEGQAGYWLGVIPAWNVFTQPLAFLLFVVCIHAEANRAPFDTAEAEQELVGGYHTEYSSMRFALFFLAEYAGMITTSAVCVALFLGGWHLPWVDYLWPALSGIPGQTASVTDSLLACFVRAAVFFGKTMGIIFLFMWVRWSLPRFRFDQIMILAWRAMIPISLAMLMATAITIYAVNAPGTALVTGPTPTAREAAAAAVSADAVIRRVLPGWEAFWLLVANLIVLGLTLVVSRLLPAPAPTNRRVTVPNSRYADTPLPGRPVAGRAAEAERAPAVPTVPTDVVAVPG